MKIAGFHKNSFVDYPGRLAAVIFTPGCNFNCFYCHNHHLLTKKAEEDLYDCEEVLRFLRWRRGFLDAVVISGGEPTLQPDLEDFIRELKKMGYPVKLDTNGSNPGVLEKLIEQDILDYVAMDIKAPFEKYGYICGVDVNIKDLKSSIDLLMKGRVEYEFRTTFVPQLSENDILRIVLRIKGARCYVLQQFRRPKLEREVVDMRNMQSPHTSDFMRSVAEKINKYVTCCRLRGLT